MQLLLSTTSSRALLVSVLAVGCGTAQQWVGFNAYATPGATSRGGLLAAGAALGRIDAGDYTGWASDPAFPGARAITGIDCIVQDQDAVLTPEVFDVGIYPEDPASPGYPLLAAGVVGAAFVPGPPPNVGVIGVAYTAVAFAAPILMPAGADVFIGLSFPAAPAFPADGISFNVVLGYTPGPAFPTFDLPGPAMGPLGPPNGPTNSYGVYTDFGAVLAYAGRRQIWADIDSTAPGGVVTALTAQATFPISGAPPGTASFMSALHPDVVAPPLNPGRADDVGYLFLDDALPGAPVFFLAAFFAFGPVVPLAFFAPGSVGVSCLGPGSMMIGLGITAADGRASLVTPIPAVVRPMLGGMVLLQQAVAIDPALGTLHGAPCGSQKM